MLKEMETEDSALYEPGIVKSATQAQAKQKRPVEDASNPEQGGKKPRPGVINVSSDSGKRWTPTEPDDEQSDPGE